MSGADDQRGAEERVLELCDMDYERAAATVAAFDRLRAELAETRAERDQARMKHEVRINEVLSLWAAGDALYRRLSHATPQLWVKTRDADLDAALTELHAWEAVRGDARTDDGDTPSAALADADRICRLSTTGDALANAVMDLLDRTWRPGLPKVTADWLRPKLGEWRSVRGDTPTDGFGSTDTVSVPPKSSQSTAPADDPDPQDEVDRLGSVLFEVCRSAMLDPFMPVDEIPREVGRLARLASAAAPDVGTAAGWVARIPGPCWVVGDPEDDWEESHHPGQVAAEDQARRWELPGPVRQLDGECWIAARAGRLVVDDDVGVVHHRTEGEARAAAGTDGGTVAPRSRDELIDRFTAAVDNACDVAAIEVEVHELEPGPNGWQRTGQVSPLRRLVRVLEGAGLLDETAIDDTETAR